MAETTGLLNRRTGHSVPRVPTSSNLVLSAKIPYRAFCEGFFVFGVSKSVTKTGFLGHLTGVKRFVHIGTD